LTMAATGVCPGSGMTYNSTTGKCEKSCPTKNSGIAQGTLQAVQYCNNYKTTGC
jgi:hypothetical protein